MNDQPRTGNRRIDPRRTRTRALVAALLAMLLIAIAAAGWWLNRSPLSGDRAHDFGLVRFDSPPKFVEHRFTLTNRTREALEIQAVRATCGCTVASASATSVAPGESFEVKVRLEFSQSGHRRKPLHIVLRDRGVVTLWIEGTGRQTRQLSSVRDEVELIAGEPAYVSIFYLRFEDEPSPPPSPAITTPPGVTATLINWKRGVRGDASEGKPDQWGGQIMLDYDGSPLADDAAVHVAVGADQTLTVRLRAAGQPADPLSISPPAEPDANGATTIDH